MKKIFAIVLMVTIICISAYAETAQNVNLSELTTEELITLRGDIDKTLYETSGSQLLYDGDYIVGEDLPSGYYVVSHWGGEHGVTVTVYKTASSREEYEEAGADANRDDYYTKHFMYDFDEVKVFLEEGEMLNVLSDGLCCTTIAKAKALFAD